jgi:hypothetical protein
MNGSVIFLGIKYALVFSDMCFQMLVAKIFITFCAMRSCHAYVATITKFIFTIGYCLRHFYTPISNIVYNG